MAVVDFTSDVGTTGNWFFWISAIVALVPAQYTAALQLLYWYPSCCSAIAALVAAECTAAVPCCC